MEDRIYWQGIGWYASVQEGVHENQHIASYQIESVDAYGPDGFYRGDDPQAPHAIWQINTKAMGLGTPFFLTCQLGGAR